MRTLWICSILHFLTCVLLLCPTTTLRFIFHDDSVMHSLSLSLSLSLSSSLSHSFVHFLSLAVSFGDCHCQSLNDNGYSFIQFLFTSCLTHYLFSEFMTKSSLFGYKWIIEWMEMELFMHSIFVWLWFPLNILSLWRTTLLFSLISISPFCPAFHCRHLRLVHHLKLSTEFNSVVSLWPSTEISPTRITTISIVRSALICPPPFHCHITTHSFWCHNLGTLVICIFGGWWITETDSPGTDHRFWSSWYCFAGLVVGLCSCVGSPSVDAHPPQHTPPLASALHTHHLTGTSKRSETIHYSPPNHSIGGV